MSCVGFFLFGVPNRGLDAHNLEILVRGHKNAQLVEDLKEGSPLLRHIDHAFQSSRAYEYCVTVSFYETKDSRIVKVCISYPSLYIAERAQTR
jgi:hypothetical protein